MNIISTEVKPYVYIAINHQTGEFYFGFRKANKVPAINAWMKGLSTETDIRVKELGRKISESLKGHFVSETTRQRQRDAALKRLKIYISCVCCRKKWGIGNYSKHIKKGDTK